MNRHPAPARPALSRWARHVALFGHLAGGLLMVFLWYPWISRDHKQKLKACWSRRLVSILGLEIVLDGTVPDGVLLVANHVSWIDIFALNAVAPSAFVAKSEIARWPLVGALCRQTETLFIERGSPRHAQHVAHTMAEQLRSGQRIALFPEGTTTEGHEILPFHAALFQPAISAGVAIQPVSIRYRDATGKISNAPAYAGETTLGETIRFTLNCTGLQVQLTALPLIHATDFNNRRDIARRAETTIREQLLKD